MELLRTNARLFWSFSLLANLLSRKELMSATTFRNETDQIALLAFKSELTGDPLGPLNMWNSSLHFCDWQGITCNPQRQRVVVLNLESQSLVGSLSPFIGNLTLLKGINLRNNSFHGDIPAELGRLSRLKHLNLTTNHFRGEIPSNLTHCLNLEVIDLNENDLAGKIPVELSSLSKLLILRLAVNNLTGSIPPSLGNLSSLTYLSLARNSLMGSIPDDLGRIASFKFLQISQNKLSGEIPPSLYNLSSIYMFSVSTNYLEGSIPPDIGLTLPNLQMLYLGTNQFTGSIPISLPNASGLSELFFTNNDFTGLLPMNLGSLRGLRKLNVGFNLLGLGKDNDLGFLTSLTNCSGLENLALEGNRFAGVLPNSIANLSTQLKMLSMGGNRIYEGIPTGIENYVNLTVLGMEGNFITGTIPISIGKLQKLQVLTLGRNTLSGEIPSSIGNITPLNILRLNGNHLEGSIPPSLANCHYLQVLDLSRNNLSGNIPKPVISLSSLSISLNLSQNSLTGPLPLEVGNLNSLGKLDISKNKLSGEIPQMLGNCLSLVYLHLEENLFNGTIPPSLSNLRGIQGLDFSSNNLSGKIPNYLEMFPFLQNLNLSFNDLDGEVPTNGVFGNVSAISVFGNSKLCGGIKELELPPCPVLSPKKHENFLLLRITIPVAGVILCLILLLGVLATLYWKKKSTKKPSSIPNMDDPHLKVSYGELFKATEGFSSDNLIGAGSYGSVYKGILDCDGTVVAVKVLNLEYEGASMSFMDECKVLRNIRHRNLVKILTSCSSLDFKGNDFKALVFEFMPNGSLEEWLHPRVSEPNEVKNLSFVQRLNVAVDVGSALEYLHHQCENTVVHCDLKPSNILLDNEKTAHVCDFGLSKLLSNSANQSSQNQISSVGIKGSVGYVAPEYGMGSKVSTQGDVYSYGILLLEMFTGKKSTEDMFKEGLTLHKFSKMALPDQVMEIADPRLFLEEEIKEEEGATIDSNRSHDNTESRMHECLVFIIGVGVSCSMESPRERMDMRDVNMRMHWIKDFYTGIPIHDERHSGA